MAYNRFEQSEVPPAPERSEVPPAPERSEEAQREELIKKIENSVEKMSLRELEALYYELSTKSYANDN